MKYNTKHKRVLWFVSLICLFTLRAYPFQSDDSLSLDSNIRSGKLTNGLSYYIKQIPAASEQVHMSLVVKVGHNHQKTGEHQFAHIVEHLGFSSGKNISLEKSSALFDEIGLTVGQISGHTWNDYTDFKMIVPGNNFKGLEVVLQFFEDIIWNLEMDELNIDKERKTVYNENNSSELDFINFLRSMERKLTGHEVKFSTKEKNDHLTSFSSEALVQFYRKWYRPDNMALVVAGNIQDIDVLEEVIRRKFAKPAQVVEPTRHDLRAQDYLLEPQFLNKPFPKPMEDPERRRATLNLFIRDKIRGGNNSVADIKTDLIKKMLVNAMNRRFSEIGKAYLVDFWAGMELADAPFALKTGITFLGKYDEDTLKEIIRIFVDVEQNGFSINEFVKSKESLIQSINKQDTLSSSYWRSAITSHYVFGKTLPANKKEVESKVLQNLTLDSFNDKVKYYLQGQPDDIIITAHPGHPVLSYSEADVRNWFSDFNEMIIEPYSVPEIPKAIIDSIVLSKLEKTNHTGGKTGIPSAKAFELQNGIKVILKSTTTPAGMREKNKIHFQGFGKTGVSHFQKEDFFSAMNAPEIVRNSGVGQLNKFELERFLNAIDFKGNVRPYIGYKEAGIKGVASIKELETALQLAYLFLTDPNFSEIAFQDWKKNESQSLAIHQDINKEDFLNVVRGTLMHPEFFPKGTKALKGLKHTDFTNVKRIYRQLFKNPHDLTFLFSGDFEEQEVLDLCRKYLGNLPAKGKTKKNVNQQALSEPLDTVLSTIIPSTRPMTLANVRLVYIPKENVYDFDWKEEIKVEILRRMMSELLMRRLRFESATGGTYMAGAGRYNSNSFNHHEIFISFESKPQDTNKLIADSKEVVNTLKTMGPEEKLFDKIKMNLISKNAEPESPQVILRKMYNTESHGRKWVDPMDKTAFLDSLTPHDILLTAKKYMGGDPYEFIMVPQ